MTEPAFLERVLAARALHPELRARGARRPADGADGRRSGSTTCSRARATRRRSSGRARRSQPDDLLTLIYTSGTTGPPKGVQITHDNIMSAVEALDEVIDFPEGARVVSYLPMAHIAERATGHYLPIVLGHTVTCCPNPREVIAYLPEVRPTLVLRGARASGRS